MRQLAGLREPGGEVTEETPVVPPRGVLVTESGRFEPAGTRTELVTEKQTNAGSRGSSEELVNVRNGP